MITKMLIVLAPIFMIKTIERLFLAVVELRELKKKKHVIDAAREGTAFLSQMAPTVQRTEMIDRKRMCVFQN